jgi:hypothetical protein
MPDDPYLWQRQGGLGGTTVAGPGRHLAPTPTPILAWAPALPPAPAARAPMPSRPLPGLLTLTPSPRRPDPHFPLSSRRPSAYVQNTPSTCVSPVRRTAEKDNSRIKSRHRKA